jgi:hypothetical protein
MEHTENSVPPTRRTGPLFEPSGYTDTKDPYPVFDGRTWHLYGTRGSATGWGILHATSPALEGPWTDQPAAEIVGVIGGSVVAPAVIHDGSQFHMFVHRDFLAVGGGIEHLTSKDGHRFEKVDTSLYSEPLSDEAGIYDPHPAEIGGKKYIAYAGTPGILSVGDGFRSEPDLFLAVSENGWEGPWQRFGEILDQETLPHHNRRDDPHYEWGLEGPQLIELPSGTILLNATCFIPGPKLGTRQRVFFAVAKKVEGPYVTLGPVLPTENADAWETGENGHAAGFIQGDVLHLFYQARHANHPEHRENKWRLGIATWRVEDLERAAEKALA